MSHTTLPLSDRLYEYYQAVATRETELLAALREETAKRPDGKIQISPEVGQFFGLLIELMGAQKALEIGVFTGYSGLCIAQALPFDGKLIACEINQDHAKTALRYWREAGLERKIEIHIAPAWETLDTLLENGHANTFDFLFIDADKENLDRYYERCLLLARPGGLIAIDNVLWNGRVADPEDVDLDTQAIRALNEKIHEDARVTLSMIPIGDGLTLARKR
ncbi:MAG: SAM-dependent methyltransferase [Verrucomicrobia bacterium Tous-C9LFEB]|nr:MAG: SAM-dependent methyltransferase [Verrucomicrobia bacterium Tous-C9LFEB]